MCVCVWGGGYNKVAFNTVFSRLPMGYSTGTRIVREPDYSPTAVLCMQ